MKTKVGKLYFQPYADDKKNILVVGPVAGKKYSEMVFPLLSPDPAKDKNISYLKYPIYLGGNRGRGQIYPDGSKSNNTVYNAPAAGKILQIEPIEKKGGYDITFETVSGEQITEKVPAGPDLVVKVGQNVQADQPLTNNPNVGGFGQKDTENCVTKSATGSRITSVFLLCSSNTSILSVEKETIREGAIG